MAKTTKKGTTTTTPPTSAKGGPFSGEQSGQLSSTNGLPIPIDLATQYKLPVGTALAFNPGPGKGMPRAPVSGQELYAAIGQSSLPPKLKDTMLKTYFPSGFDPFGKDKSKVFGAVTLKLEGNNYSLTNLTSPSMAQIGGTTTAQIIQNLQAQADTSQASLGLQRQQMTIGLSQVRASTEASAYGVISSYLNSWGIPQIGQDLWHVIAKQGDHVVNTDALLNIVRGNATSGLGSVVDARIKGAYQAAFPGLADYNSSTIPGAMHMTETAYQQYTQAIMDSATAYGAPAPNQNDIGKLLNGHVSAAEYKQRVSDIYAVVSNADQNTKNILEQQYGVGPSDLMHYFMDPKTALQKMQRQVAGAEIQDYATRVGLKGIDQQGVGQLADMAKLAAAQGNNQLGYGVSQIQNALLSASRDIALTKANPGATPSTISTNQLIGSQLAGFAGTNQVAEQVQVARAEQAAAAPFEKGGGFVETAKGVTGLGSART
jgi:hypothetical protein